MDHSYAFINNVVYYYCIIIALMFIQYTSTNYQFYKFNLSRHFFTSFHPAVSTIYTLYKWLVIHTSKNMTFLSCYIRECTLHLLQQTKQKQKKNA